SGTSASTVNLLSAFSDATDPSAKLTYSITADSNPGLFTSTAINAGMLTLSYAPGTLGTTQLTLRATDTSGLYVETTLNAGVFTSMPSFVAGPDQSINLDSLPQTVP